MIIKGTVSDEHQRLLRAFQSYLVKARSVHPSAAALYAEGVEANRQTEEVLTRLSNLQDSSSLPVTLAFQEMLLTGLAKAETALDAIKRPSKPTPQQRRSDPANVKAAVDAARWVSVLAHTLLATVSAVQPDTHQLRKTVEDLEARLSHLGSERDRLQNGIIDLSKQAGVHASEMNSLKASAAKIKADADRVIAEASGKVDSSLNDLDAKIAAKLLSSQHQVQQDFETLRTSTEENIRNVLVATQEKTNEVNAQAETLLEKARNVRAETGMAIHAGLFKNAANKHQRSSVWWLLFGALMTLCAVLWLTAGPKYWIGSAHRASPHDYAVYFFGNTVLLGLALYCGRVYRAERHNMVVNQHRQNALTSYQAIIDGASGDEQMRAAIIMHATQTIFAPQPTGHWEARSSGAQDQVPLPVLQLIGEAARGAKRSSEN